MKKKFLESWRGSDALCQQSMWHPAEGSSLTEEELGIINAGGVVRHPKGRSLSKLFVRDEDQKLWSLIIHNFHLVELEKSLKEVGYHLIPA